VLALSGPLLSRLLPHRLAGRDTPNLRLARALRRLLCFLVLTRRPRLSSSELQPVLPPVFRGGATQQVGPK
jgi:hypothetical protein